MKTKDANMEHLKAQYRRQESGGQLEAGEYKYGLWAHSVWAQTIKPSLSSQEAFMIQGKLIICFISVFPPQCLLHKAIVRIKERKYM